MKNTELKKKQAQCRGGVVLLSANHGNFCMFTYRFDVLLQANMSDPWMKIREDLGI